ncbi:MAG: hypothetical protein OJI67_04140 [Prosthecobacter sp.]|nr:hypothetical protein [Prosthecobacter sp.]
MVSRSAPRVVPTQYGGVIFRSRLEATWAYFFDSIGLPWKYEPFDIEGWTPDFLLQGTILCEVKPEIEPVKVIYTGSPYKKSILAWNRALAGCAERNTFASVSATEDCGLQAFIVLANTPPRKM